jgi:hypothetical protein
MRLRGGRISGRVPSLANANAYYSGVWSLYDVYDELVTGTWKYNLVPGLAGKFFNGIADATLGDGSTGFTLPLDATNNSSNVTGSVGMPSAAHRYGVNIWPNIAYGDASVNGQGDNYGFIAIGYFFPPETGTYTFYTSSDDGSGVWIGDIASASSGRTTANATVNNGMQAGGQGNTERSGTISLNAGQRYAIRIVHQEGSGGDNLTFSWASPTLITKTTNLSVYFKAPYIPAIGAYNYIEGY